MTEKLKFSRSQEDEDPKHCGFTYSVEFPFPLEQIWKDGYGMSEPIKDERGRIYWEIINLREYYHDLLV